MPGSVCPFPTPPTPGQPCPQPGELDCHYDKDQCCCGNCAQNFTVSCVSDNSGAGLWKMSTLCPPDGCGSEGKWCPNVPFHNLERLPATGVVTSPNYPGNYPDNVDTTETIKVKEGLVISLQFTAFDIEPHSTCVYDHLTITDGDGTTLMEKSCGSSLPADIRSISNTVNIYFSTDASGSRPGWAVSWSAVTSGLCK